MRLDRLKASKVEELLNEVERAQTRLDALRVTDESQLWLDDLEEFEVEYDKMIASRLEAETTGPTRKKVVGGSKMRKALKA
jgi:hypothetical protein